MMRALILEQTDSARLLCTSLAACTSHDNSLCCKRYAVQARPGHPAQVCLLLIHLYLYFFFSSQILSRGAKSPRPA